MSLLLPFCLAHRSTSVTRILKFTMPFPPPDPLNQLAEGSKHLYAADACIISQNTETHENQAKRKRKESQRDAYFLIPFIPFGPWARVSLSMHSNLLIMIANVLHNLIPVNPFWLIFHCLNFTPFTPPSPPAFLH